MQKQGTTRRCLAVLAVLASYGVKVSARADADNLEGPKPLPPEIVKTWCDAGAALGWMKMNPTERPKFQSQATGEPGAIPVFQFSEWKEGVLAKLPDPGAAFGLSLNATKVDDAGLKELAGLKSLQALYLDETRLTDAGLKELAGLKSLQTLDLRNNKLTDAGMKELAGLEGLQRLYLNHCPVTDEGIRRLAGLKRCKG